MADKDLVERAPSQQDVFQVDDSLGPVQAVLKYSFADELQLRIAYIQGLAAAACLADEAELQQLMDVLERLLEDEVTGVKLVCLDQIQKLAKLSGECCNPPVVLQAAMRLIREQLQGLLKKQGAGSSNFSRLTINMTKEAAMAAFDSVCEAVGPEATTPAAERLCALVGGSVALAADQAQIALTFAGVAARRMLPAAAVGCVLPLLSKLARHSDHSVRQAVASALPEVYVSYATNPVAQRMLLEDYALLCKDKIWNVRQACATMTPHIARIVATGGYTPVLSAAPALSSASVSGSSARAAGSCKSASDGGGGGGGGGAADADGPASLSGSSWGSAADSDNATCAAASCSDGRAAAAVAAAEARQLQVVRDLYLGVLLKSKSNWITLAAKQVAGAVIEALLPAVSAALLPQLLDLFCSTATAVGQGAAELRLACAEALAGVLEKGGASQWPRLQQTYHRLLGCQEPAVLHQLVPAAQRLLCVLAPALGHDAAVAAVMPGLLAVLRGQLSTAGGALAGCLVALMGECTLAMRMQLVELIPELCRAPEAPGYCGAWRPRYALACQLPELFDAAGPELSHTVAQCALTLASDPVWAVRHEAAAQLGRILHRLVPPLGVAADDEAGERMDSSTGQQGVSDGDGAASPSGRGCKAGLGADVLDVRQQDVAAGQQDGIGGKGPGDVAGTDAAAAGDVGSGGSSSSADVRELCSQLAAVRASESADEAGFSGAPSRKLTAAQEGWRQRVVALAQAGEGEGGTEGAAAGRAGSGALLQLLGEWLAALSCRRGHQDRQLLRSVCCSAVAA